MLHGLDTEHSLAASLWKEVIQGSTDHIVMSSKGLPLTVVLGVRPLREKNMSRSLQLTLAFTR